MELHRAVVHVLDKQRLADGTSPPATIRLRAADLPAGEQLNALVARLRTLYNSKTGRGYGIFSPDQVGYPLSSFMVGYAQAGWDFIAFTHNAMQLLKQRIDQAALATGGYIFFAHYTEGGEDFMLIASLKNRPGLVFNELLELANQQHIDLDQLHEMARVNLSGWTSGAERYLSFAKRRSSNDDFTRYFREFIGCDEFTQSKALTRGLLEALALYNERPEVTAESRSRHRQIVFEYCEEKRATGERISIRALSGRLSDDAPEAFLDFVNQQADLAVADDFEPDASVYRTLRRISGGDKGIRVSFDADLINKRVIYDRENNALIMRDLPPSLVRLMEDL
ncbi:nucleoid-associated protein [Paraburkholderia strydomiana]|uniref:nucleoid-associated protein n=1 Tax=Paraburkholderia strydomiana TaxID=1245417 RepID=UPI0038BDF8E0